MVTQNDDYMKEKKIKRIFIKNEAYDRLNRLIVSGELKPMTKIKIQDLSEELGISRTPLREAILKLENDGLIISKANRWTMVAPINLNDALNIYPIISSLEILALREGFYNISSEDLKELKEINEKINNYNPSDDLIERIKIDNVFHKKIIELSGNTEIYPIIENLKNKVQRMEIFYYEQIQEYSKTYDAHQRIISYIENDDLEQAILALRKNWRDTLEIFETIIIQEGRNEKINPD